MKKRIWFEASYSTWKNNEAWKQKIINTWPISLPILSKDLEKTDFGNIVNDILKK